MPLKFNPGGGDDRIFTPEESQRLAQATQRRQKAEGRFLSLSRIAMRRADELDPNSVLPGLSLAPGVNDEPGFLNVAKDIGVGVLDVISRGNYVAAGIADELLVKKTGPMAALGRAAKELLSGIGSIEGEKDTFRDVLDGLDLVNETRLGQSIDAVDGVPIVGGFNLRGTVGLTLDIFLDPLTYLTGGGSALAKVPKAFRGVRLAGKSRLVGTVDDAAEAFTRAGRKARSSGAKKELAALRADPTASQAILSEADRLAVEEVQDRLMLNLVDEGVRVGRAGELTRTLVGNILDAGKGEKAAIDAVFQTLKGMNSKTVQRVKLALGMATKQNRSQIGAVLAAEVRDRAGQLVRTGLDEGGELSLLAGDIAMKRATHAVLELAKNGQGDLVRSVAPLRMSLPFSDIGFNIGPAGKSLTEWVVQSGISGKMVGALTRVLPPGIVNGAVEAAAAIRKPIDLAGRLLDTNWTARKLAGFHVLRRASLDATAAAVGKNLSALADTKTAKWYDSVLKSTVKDRAKREATFREFAIALDTGNLKNLSGEALEAAHEFRAIMRETVARDVRKGLMKADNVRRNYFPHFMDHPERIVRKMAERRPGRRTVQQATIGRFAEARSFDSILDIEAAAKLLGVDPKINFDPMLALRNRTQASVEGAMYDDFYQSVAHEFGREAKPFKASDYYEMAKPLATGKAALVAERLARGKFKPTPEQLDRLTAKYGKGSVGEFLRQRLESFTSPHAALRFVRKYESHIEALPRLPSFNATDLAPDGSAWVSMPPAFKGLKGYDIPASAKEVIDGMRVQTARSPEVDEFLGMFDSFTNGLKVYLTALFPAFHFRNAYSNVAQGFLDMGLAALNPFVHTRAAKLAALTMDDTGQVLTSTAKRYLTPENLKAKAWTDPDGTIVTLGEAARELKRNHIVRSSKEIFEGTRVQGRPVKGSVPIQGLSNFRKTASYWKRAGTSAGGFIEAEGRIAVYTQMRMKGLSEIEATDRVNKLLFDYDALTEFERTYLKRAIPFYVWTKKNIALQASAIRNMPGRVVNISKPFNNEDEDVTGSLLEYQAGQFRIQMDRNGKDVKMMTGIDLPIMSIDRLLPVGKIVRGDFSSAIKQIGASMNPLLKAPAELAANESFFDERSLDRATSSSIGKFLDPDGASGKVIPDSVRRWLGYNRTTFPDGKNKYEFDGQKFHLLFRTWHVSRFLTSSDAWFRRASQEQSLAANLLAVATSIRIGDMNLDNQQARVFEERTRKLEEALVRQGLLKKTRTSFEIKDTPRFRQQR